MWWMIFTLLPVAGMGYIAWHIWCLLPLGTLYKVLLIALMAGSFLLMFGGMRGMMNNVSLPTATAMYGWASTTRVHFVSVEARADSNT